MATAAERDHGSPRQAELFSVGVLDRKLPFNADWSVVNYSNFRCHPPDGSRSNNGGCYNSRRMIQFLLESDREIFEEAFRFAQHQVRKLVEKYPDFYPMYTVNGQWKHEGAAWTQWADGFLPGLMWIFYKRNAQNGSD